MCCLNTNYCSEGGVNNIAWLIKGDENPGLFHWNQKLKPNCFSFLITTNVFVFEPLVHCTCCSFCITDERLNLSVCYKTNIRCHNLLTKLINFALWAPAHGFILERAGSYQCLFDHWKKGSFCSGVLHHQHVILWNAPLQICVRCRRLCAACWFGASSPGSCVCPLWAPLNRPPACCLGGPPARPGWSAASQTPSFLPYRCATWCGSPVCAHEGKVENSWKFDSEISCEPLRSTVVVWAHILSSSKVTKTYESRF